jgi:hypothetical protein
MADTSTLPGAVRAASTASLKVTLTSLESLLKKKEMVDSPILSHYESQKNEIASEINRREVADSDIATSPFSTHVIAQLFAYFISRNGEVKQGYGHYNTKSRLVLSSKKKFSTELVINDIGAVTRAKHLDEALTRLHARLVEKTAALKKTFPSAEVSSTHTDLAERVQKVLLFADITGTDAFFEWEARYQHFRFGFDREYAWQSVKGKDLVSQLTTAIVKFESMAIVSPL